MPSFTVELLVRLTIPKIPHMDKDYHKFYLLITVKNEFGDGFSMASYEVSLLEDK